MQNFIVLNFQNELKIKRNAVVSRTLIEIFKSQVNNTVGEVQSYYKFYIIILT